MKVSLAFPKPEQLYIAGSIFEGVQLVFEATEKPYLLLSYHIKTLNGSVDLRYNSRSHKLRINEYRRVQAAIPVIVDRRNELSAKIDSSFEVEDPRLGVRFKNDALGPRACLLRWPFQAVYSTRMSLEAYAALDQFIEVKSRDYASLSGARNSISRLGSCYG